MYLIKKIYFKQTKIIKGKMIDYKDLKKIYAAFWDSQTLVNYTFQNKK